jgi:hypothetical protein
MFAMFTATNDDDVTVTWTKRCVDTHGRGYRNFNQHEPKADTARVRVGGTTPAAILPMPRRTTCGSCCMPRWTSHPQLGRFASDGQTDTTRTVQGASRGSDPRDWRFVMHHGYLTI